LAYQWDHWQASDVYIVNPLAYQWSHW